MFMFPAALKIFILERRYARMNEEEEKIRILNYLSLEVKDEDHTLLNPLRWCISNNWVGDKVEFCGYTIPHPSERVGHLTVQFEEKDIQSPKHVLKKVYEGLECLELIASSILEKIK